MHPHRFVSGSILGLSLALATSVVMPVAAADKPLDKGAVEQIVHDYILAHPDILVQALDALDQKQQAEAEQARVDNLKSNQKALEQSEMSPVGGNLKGDVTLVEFFDYNCPYCKRTQPERAAAVKGDGKVRVVYKELPILSPASKDAAKAALAANKQGKYEAFHAALMTHEGRVDSSVVRAVAKDIGLDIQKLEKDINDPAIEAEIKANIELAQRLGIRGTPGFVVGDTVVPGAIDTERFIALFNASRAAKKAAG